MKETVFLSVKVILTLAAALFLPSCLMVSIVAGSDDLVLGQINFLNNQANFVSAEGLHTAVNVTVDNVSGRVYVCDTFNNRVLWWNNAASRQNGASADGVIGQPDFYSSAPACTQTGMYSPIGVAADSSGNVWVSDALNHRVLKFAKPAANGQAAVLVLGQADFMHGSANQGLPVSSTTMNNPSCLCFDHSGNLWVADWGNNRVIEFTNPGAYNSNDEGANLALGQADLSSSASNCTSTNMNSPWGVSVDTSDNIWVADEKNFRALEFSSPFTTGMSASIVLGQQNFTSSVNGCSQTEMSDVSAISVDGSGNVWILEWGNSGRVLEFSPPFSVFGSSANVVIGQPSWISGNDAGCTAYSLNVPNGMCTDAAGDIWVADNNNNRVVEFKPPFSVFGSSATLALGQPDFTHSLVDEGQGLTPYDVAVDTAVGRLYICDDANNRVLWWNSASSLADGQNPDGAIGQPDIYSNNFDCSAAGLGSANGVAVDSSGNVWVADIFNNRVLRFIRPASSGASANLVLGAPDFTTNTGGCVASQTLLSNPTGVSVDSSGNAWVSDNGNNRVLKFSAQDINNFSPGTPVPASVVLGEPDFNSVNAVCASTGMNAPQHINVDNFGSLWVADSANNRVLKFSPPFSSGMAASLVLGATDFITNSYGVCTSSGMNNPWGVSVDNSGNAWVADYANNRILKFSSPVTTGKAASFVIGQSGFTSNASACAETGLSKPSSLLVDGSGNLWVTDLWNNRVLKFNSADVIASTGAVTTVVPSTNTTTNPATTITFSKGTLFVPAGTLSGDALPSVTLAQVPFCNDPTVKPGAFAIQITNNSGFQPFKNRDLYT